MRSNSSIVRAFVQTQQEMSLKGDGAPQVAVITEPSRRRREAVEKRKGKSSKKEESFGQNVSKAEQFRNMDEHKIALEELLTRLETSEEKGLTQTKASELNAKFGDNVLTEKKGVPWYIKLLKEMVTFFSLLLWLGTVLCFIAYGLNPSDPSNLIVAVLCAFIVLLSGFVTFFQNQRSEAIMAGFKNFIPAKANVLRDSSWRSMEASKLVPGDILKIKMGDKIPADIRMINVKEMKVDNSSLTGESDPLIRTIECTNKENALETANVAFFGTLCKEGECLAVVIKIGDNTVIGQIANLAASAENEETPLHKEMDRFITIIGAIAIGLALIFFCLGFAVGYPAIVNFGFAIGICVANIPESLPVILTIALTTIAKKLATKKVLVKNLESVETLGSTTCICSDKTGTLTQNVMTVQHLWYDGKLVAAPNKQLKGPSFNYEYDSDSIGFRYLQECAIVCNEAFFNNAAPEHMYAKLGKITDAQEAEAKRHEIDQIYTAELRSKMWVERPTVGDASETALIKFYQPIEDIAATRGKCKIRINDDRSESKIAFNSVNKFALYIVEYPTSDSDYCLFIKGAPERIWDMCDKVYCNGSMEMVDNQWKKRYDQVNVTLAKQGERVLGFAKFHLPRNEFPKNFQFKTLNLQTLNVPLKNLAFLGLIALIDPPREAVPYSVIKCKAAGIKVIMVTGDQPVTATAIARKCNIITDKTVAELIEEDGMAPEEALLRARAIVIHGDQLAAAMREDEGLPEDEKGLKLSQWLQKPQIVFARTSPAQKLIIVDACQKQGHCVAVTGDGVNDSPAIKKADIGVAMGITGSDVAKDAADMVLLTDDFTAIIMGVEEGRRLFDNIKKAIIYCLTSNIAELVPFLAFVIFQIPLPLSSILVLCITVGTDLVPISAYVFEEAEMDLMTRPPRMQWEHMVTRRLIVFSYLQNGWIEALCGMISYFVVMRDFGFGFWSLFFTVTWSGFNPNAVDVYDETVSNLGNSDVYCANGEVQSYSGQSAASPDWTYLLNEDTDLRHFFVECTSDNVLKTMWNWGECYIPQISGITQRPVCYSTDALKYAQSAFFYGVVFGQMSNIHLLKTRVQSIKYQGLRNFFMTFSIHFEAALMLFLAYFAPLNLWLGTRDVVWYHFGIPGLPISIVLFLHEEIRKYLIRNWPRPDATKPNWFYRNSLW